MTQEHPIRPPHELVQQWVSLACENEGYETWQDLATQAARWGADQELEACCVWLRNKVGTFSANAHLEAQRRSDNLRAARRPKTPSLKKRALAALDDAVIRGDCITTSDAVPAIRRALESLPD